MGRAGRKVRGRPGPFWATLLSKTSITTTTVSEEERQAEEQAERARPRVVDKRVSSRRASGVKSGAAAEGGLGTAGTPGPADVDEPAAVAPAAVPTATPPPHTPPPEPPVEGRPAGSGEQERIWTPEEEAEAKRVAQEISARPSIEWVLNVAVTLANVAGTKLDLGDAADARLAIDALAGIVNGVGTSLADAENPLRQTLAQLQLAYAQAMTPPAP